MKKYFLVVLSFLFFTSCKPNNDKPLIDGKKDGKTILDSTLVGADKDENGCLASAGYTYSKLRKECVRVFTGIQLNPFEDTKNEDPTLSVYLLFSEDGNEAELFLPNEESVILTRKSEGMPWIFNDYQLIPWKGYVLKKAGKIIYSGDGEVGNKVTGSDKNED